MANVAVVGAGPAGLAATRRLLEAGLNVTVFERKSQCGGTWVHEASEGENTSRDQVQRALKDHAPPSACYESLVNNIALPLMEYDGHRYPEETNWFVSSKQILEYLQTFARQSGADAVVKMKTSVVKAEKTSDGKWCVTSKYLSLAPTSTEDLLVETHENMFDFLLIGTGHYDRPHMPPIPGLDEWLRKWPRNIMHSKTYRNNSSYKDQTILIVGAGSSAFDLSREIAYVGKVVYQSVRTKPGLDLRSETEKIFEKGARSVVPDNVHRVAEISQLKCPLAAKKMADAEICLVDGTLLTGVDHIIFCTGYRFYLPFLDDSQFRDETPIISDGLQLHNLHKDIFYIADPTLAFIGVQYEISTFPFFDIEAMAIASVFAGQVDLPSKLQMQQEYEHKKRLCGTGKQFHVLGWEKECLYMRELAAWIDTPELHALVSKYEARVQDVRSRQIETFKERMLQTTKFRDQSPQELKEMIERKGDEIQLALANMAT